MNSKRRPAGSVFAVYRDEPSCSQTDAAPASPLKSKTTYKAPSKRAIVADKENNNKSVLAGKSLVPLSSKASNLFNGKVPFELASPIATQKELNAQRLGFFAPQPSTSLRVKKRSASDSAPFSSTASTSSSSSAAACADRTGDPIKPARRNPAAGSKTLGRRTGKVMAEDLGLGQMSIWDQSNSPLPSPVLANVTEAYTGNDGFHFSPMVCSNSCYLSIRANSYEQAEKPSQIASPSGATFHILPSEDHLDSPIHSSVVLTGSPIKKGRVAPRMLSDKPLLC